MISSSSNKIVFAVLVLVAMAAGCAQAEDGVLPAEDVAWLSAKAAKCSDKGCGSAWAAVGSDKQATDAAAQQALAKCLMEAKCVKADELFPSAAKHLEHARQQDEESLRELKRQEHGADESSEVSDSEPPPPPPSKSALAKETLTDGHKHTHQGMDASLYFGNLPSDYPKGGSKKLSGQSKDKAVHARFRRHHTHHDYSEPRLDASYAYEHLVPGLSLDTSSYSHTKRAQALIETEAGIDANQQIWAGANFNFAAGNVALAAVQGGGAGVTAAHHVRVYADVHANDAFLEIQDHSNGDAVIQGGEPGRFVANTEQNNAGNYFCVHITFKPVGVNPNVERRYCTANRGDRDTLHTVVQTTVWATDAAGVNNPANPANPGGMVAANPNGANRPAWDSLPNPSDFGYAWEVEGQTMHILQLYKPIGVARATWADLLQSTREALVRCFFYGGQWHNVRRNTCNAWHFLYFTSNAAKTAVFNALTAGVNGPPTNWERFERCSPMCTKTVALVGFNWSNRRVSCVGGIANMDAYISERLHQEQWPPTWEINRDGPTNALNTARDEVKCVQQTLIENNDFPSSMHLHVSMRPSRKLAITKSVVAYSFWLNLLLSLPVLVNNPRSFKNVYFGVSSQADIAAAMGQLTHGRLRTETNNHGTNWGNLKTSLVALRQGPYGHGRIGFEFRVGNGLPSFWHSAGNVLGGVNRNDIVAYMDATADRVTRMLAVLHERNVANNDHAGQGARYSLFGRDEHPIYWSYDVFTNHWRGHHCPAQNNCPVQFGLHHVRAWNNLDVCLAMQVDQYGAGLRSTLWKKLTGVLWTDWHTLATFNNPGANAILRMQQAMTAARDRVLNHFRPLGVNHFGNVGAYLHRADCNQGIVEITGAMNDIFTHADLRAHLWHRS
eukprot:TRINITY_DN65830_c11_g7_i1.p1 TRINITY_DN65830_c11_g7~~TRINITY_DN65830_c11_g7_i1.p1  ORF type:complete len:896 (-),score=369.02 TRINITY_DN65830_c11_g7_i1:1558-4245(-)